MSRTSKDDPLAGITRGWGKRLAATGDITGRCCVISMRCTGSRGSHSRPTTSGKACSSPGSPIPICASWHSATVEFWVQRLIWRLHAVLARLDAEGPFADVFRAALDTPLVPLPITAAHTLAS